LADYAIILAVILLLPKEKSKCPHLGDYSAVIEKRRRKKTMTINPIPFSSGSLLIIEV
jgi:hypothetical protein